MQLLRLLLLVLLLLVLLQFKASTPPPPTTTTIVLVDCRLSVVLLVTSELIAEASTSQSKEAQEFSDTDKFMSIGEKLFGEYVWGVYDLLVLPPSFPYGGMENPCLTFVTPTLLAGDKSLADVVAHEITHSWFGNLCTNRSWECFWLNEGFTKFGECRIMQNMNGKDYEQLLLRNLCIKLKEDISHFGNGHEFTKLCVSAAIIPFIRVVL